MYVRGHKIASGGMNRTGMIEDWMSLDWDNQIGAMVAELTDNEGRYTNIVNVRYLCIFLQCLQCEWTSLWKLLANHS